MSCLLLCHIYQVLCASIYSVSDPDIIWFVPICIQFILVSHIFMLVLMIFWWDYILFQLWNHVWLLCWFFHEVRWWVFWIKQFYLLLSLICLDCKYIWYFGYPFVLCWVLDTAYLLEIIEIFRLNETVCGWKIRLVTCYE